MFEEIKDVIVNAIHVEAAKVIPSAKLREDLNIDSLSAVELALELETTFDILIEDAELVGLVTVQDVMDVVSRKRA